MIAKNFFQLEGESGLTSLILTYASFAIAFFFRPLGRWYLAASATGLAANRR